MKHAKIFRRALLLVWTLTCLLGAPSQGRSADEASATLARDVQRRFVSLTAIMSRLLESTESQDVGGRLDVALMRSNDLKVLQRLEVIRQYLVTKSYRDALEEEKLVERDLRRIYLVLQGLDDLETVRSDREERQALEDELEQLERIQEEQQKNLEETEEMLAQQNSASEGQDDALQEELKKKKAELARKLEETQRKIDQARRSLGRQSREKQSSDEQQDKPKDNQEKQDKRKQNQNDPQDQRQQQAQPQSNPRPSESGKRTAQAAKKSRQSLSKASRKLKSAAQRLRAENVEASRRDQEEALARIKQAREEIERDLEEKNKKEQKKFMEMAISRLRRMLADQQLLRVETEDLHASVIAAREPRAETDADAGQPSDSEELSFQGRSLARRERAIETDAMELRELFAEEGSSSIAPAMLESVESDLQTIAERLDRLDAAEHTRSIQRDVETTLTELIEALKKKASGGGGGGGGGRPPKLLGPVKELRLLLNMQRRVRKRTERLELPQAKALLGVEALPEGGREQEVQRLAETQSEIGALLEIFGQRYAIIDQYLLGQDNQGTANGQDFQAPRGSDWNPDDLLPDPWDWKGKNKKKDAAKSEDTAPK